ncbi:hypothetical protein OIO90_005972 [Microbotryomycetes sp. JL221]|nr:hypothetical protein OIO90_005972 [Microbotryomycetes sp. JL221]
MSVASTSKLVVDKVDLVNQANSNDEFVTFRARMRMPIAPCWSARGTLGGQAGQGGLEGVKEVLASWVLRYLPPIKGVLLSFDPQPTFAHPSESFKAKASPFSTKRSTHLLDDQEDPSDEDETDSTSEPKQVQLKVLPMIEGSGFALAYVNWQGMAWRPRIGQQIVGSPTLSTPSHISLLLHDLFNASIPATHVPSDVWYFDPEYPVPDVVQQRQQLELPTLASATDATNKVSIEENGEADDNDEATDDQDEEEQQAKQIANEVEQEEDSYRQHGWWLRRDTNEPLGGEQGRIQFTIVGITIANGMISVTGSLLDDPFSPDVAKASTSALPHKAKKTPASKVKPSHKDRNKQLTKQQEPDDQSGAQRSDESDHEDDHHQGSQASSRSPSPEPRVAPPSVHKADKKSKHNKREHKDRGDQDDAEEAAAKKKAKKERRKSKA